jgi:hypothetical protein
MYILCLHAYGVHWHFLKNKVMHEHSISVEKVQFKAERAFHFLMFCVFVVNTCEANREHKCFRLKCVSARDVCRPQKKEKKLLRKP